MLDTFLGALPKGWQYGVEIRNKGWLVPEYFDMLRSHIVKRGLANSSDRPNWDAILATGHLRTLPIMIKRILAHLLLALAYGVMLNSFFVAWLVPRFHGNTYDPSRDVVYFVVNGHQMPALPYLAWGFLFIVTLPAVLSVVVAIFRPYPQLTTRTAIIIHSLFLLAATIVNLLCIAAMAFKGWNKESF